MRCGTIVSYQSAYFRDCKALLVTSLTHVSGTIASVQTFAFTFTSGDVRETVCTVANKLHIVHRDTGIDVPVLTKNIVYPRAAKVRGRPKGTLLASP